MAVIAGRKLIENVPFFIAYPIFLIANSTLYGSLGINPELESNLQTISLTLACITGHSTPPITTRFSH